MLDFRSPVFTAFSDSHCMNRGPLKSGALGCSLINLVVNPALDDEAGKEDHRERAEITVSRITSTPLDGASVAFPLPVLVLPVESGIVPEAEVASTTHAVVCSVETSAFNNVFKMSIFKGLP